ncbi:MAG: ATP synthase F1 subunit gamma [Candidatus Omnitrophota bacterium]
MAQPVKQVINRIRSVENIRKISSAMEMVSIAKLNRTEKFLYPARIHMKQADSFFRNCAGSGNLSHSPLAHNQAKGAADTVLVITSDNGLCGAYNSNVIRFAEEFFSSKGRDRFNLIVIGKKGFSYFKKAGVHIIESYLDLNGRYREDLVRQIHRNIISAFLFNKAACVYAIYSHFENALTHKPCLEQILPVENKYELLTQPIFEPDAAYVVRKFLPEYVFYRLRLIFLESFTCEHASRAFAMQLATDNAKELLEGLVLLKNKMRQATITQDIMEIISSAEALKGH